MSSEKQYIPYTNELKQHLMNNGTAWERDYISEIQSQESMSTCSSTLGLARKLFVSAGCMGTHHGFTFEIDSWHGFTVRDTGSKKKKKKYARIMILRSLSVLMF